jgi:hypothetical protein
VAIFSHARCENPPCGDIIEINGEEDELLDQGWLTIAYGPQPEDRADFCCRTCAAAWLCSDEAGERLSAVMAREEEDE